MLGRYTSCCCFISCITFVKGHGAWESSRMCGYVGIVKGTSCFLAWTFRMVHHPLFNELIITLDGHNDLH